ncbi:unnamed protein product [Caenorhabditis bovis]|uniref:PPM-type phosphatase domain-containing protein n=1 Tax=Caenorhabditis bovis TaxID=2654633 RepID=A0A8S1F0Y9_9PELO|nr:unnamed protein product [Caenorhabditis bovis]
METAARIMANVVGRTSTQSEPAQNVEPIVDVSELEFQGKLRPQTIEKHDYPYFRPEFLYFCTDDIVVSADHLVRPVICPKFPARMPLFAGYAEAINSGKTLLNEDQATAKMLLLTTAVPLSPETAKAVLKKQMEEDDFPILSKTPRVVEVDVDFGPRVEAAYFGIFDGHAGTAAAILASKSLHEHIKSRLVDALDHILTLDRFERHELTKRRSESSYSLSSTCFDKVRIESEELVKGALETAFLDMDDCIKFDKGVWKLHGGCAAIVVLVFLGKIYVANAGDCRALLVSSLMTRQLSRDLTPATERKRLQEIAFRKPELLGNSFTRLEYSRRLVRKDLNTRVLYRDWYMDGWSTKRVDELDLRTPMITGATHKKRLLSTIGVTRGLGDQTLKTAVDKLPIKPFLSAVPEISVFNLRELDSINYRDVIILASDGFWDVMTNEDASLIVRSSLGVSDFSDPNRYTLAAQELVIAARGTPHAKNTHKWVMASGGMASHDDITVFVIPLKYCAAPPNNLEESDNGEMNNNDNTMEAKEDAKKKDVKEDAVTKEDDVKKDEVKEQEVTEGDVKKDEDTKDDVKKNEVREDDAKKDEVRKDDVKEDDVKKDDVKEQEVTEDDVKKDEVREDDEKDEVGKDDVKEDEAKKDDVKEQEVTEDDVKKDEVMDGVVKNEPNETS